MINVILLVDKGGSLVLGSPGVRVQMKNGSPKKHVVWQPTVGRLWKDWGLFIDLLI